LQHVRIAGQAAHTARPISTKIHQELVRGSADWQSAVSRVGNPLGVDISRANGSPPPWPATRRRHGRPLLRYECPLLRIAPFFRPVRSDVGQAFQPAGAADFPVRRNARLFPCRGMPAPSWGLIVPGTGRLESLPYELKASLRYECPLLRIAPSFRPVRSDVGQAFQPAGSADFPVRRNARLFRCRGMPAPSWGLTVPGTGRLESLPYELKASAT